MNNQLTQFRNELGTANPLFVGSIPTRASIPYAHRGVGIGQKKWLIVTEKTISISDFVSIPVTILVKGGTERLSLKFKYKGHAHTSFLNCTLSELRDQDVQTIVTKKIQEIDKILTLEVLLEFILDCEECGGNVKTRKKNIAHFKDFCKREGISLTESTKYLLQTDELGRTLPERWQALYGLPHKLRQVRSLFSRKNLVLFSRKGWDTSHFGNFVAFVPESTVSQPFTTTDEEVDRIIGFFNERKESDPVFYDIYLLAFGCGLRKSEIYQVRREHFTTFNKQHFLLLPFATKRSKLKGTDHIEKVGISAKVYEHFTNKEEGQIVSGGERLHKRFIKFLKKELGITENKACHRLRKILGARLATTHGIYHAAKTLRNSVNVAERYYSDLTAHRNELEV